MRVGVNNIKLVEKVAKHEGKVLKLGVCFGFVYKMLKAKELGVRIEYVEIPTRPIEVHEKLRRKLVL